MIYICIPVFNRLQYTIQCIESIYRQKNCCCYEIVICDDGSTDGTSEYLAKNYPDVTVLQGDGNLWWTGGINACVSYVLGKSRRDDFIFTLNNDTELYENTLSYFIAFAEKKPHALIGGLNLFFNDPTKIEVTAFRKKGNFPFSQHHRLLYPWGTNVASLNQDYEEVDSLSGKGVLIPIEVFHSIGMYDSIKLPHYHADTEFTRRAARAGYKNYIYYQSKILSHQETTGATQVNFNFPHFLNSFFTIRSTNHFRTNFNFSLLAYRKMAIPYFIFMNACIVRDFLRRYLKQNQSNLIS
jgi:GT2 family glycosyltransferase